MYIYALTSARPVSLCPNADDPRLQGITVTLMLRSVGALIFGSLSDRYGRKWPFIFNLFLFIIFELASGFCQTLPQFLGVRSLYGIAMGGLFGPAAATALEDLPYDARGLLSGLYQQGYAMGYLLAAIFYRALVPTTPDGWRSIFWFGAGPPVLIIAYRLWLPETNHFQVMAAEREEMQRLKMTHGGAERAKQVGARAWMSASWRDIKGNWVLFIYMIFLMTGFNSCSHGVSLSLFAELSDLSTWELVWSITDVGQTLLYSADRLVTVPRSISDVPQKPSR